MRRANPRQEPWPKDVLPECNRCEDVDTCRGGLLFTAGLAHDREVVSNKRYLTDQQPSALCTVPDIQMVFFF